MAIGGYFFGGYWCSLMVIILVAIGDYSIDGYILLMDIGGY
jgi:hypothetical protein